MFTGVLISVEVDIEVGVGLVIKFPLQGEILCLTMFGRLAWGET